MSLCISAADRAALAAGDHVYLNDKGAAFYKKREYAAAVEYYRLAAAMGNADSVSNLGYCYLYGRSVPVDVPLALLYFELAAQSNQIDALGKLGMIYRSGFGDVPQDEELSVYYLRKAMDALSFWNAELTDYPALCFVLGREFMPGGHMVFDPQQALPFFQAARTGFQRELQEGITWHQKDLDSVECILRDPCFKRFL